ncbi:hypothetical protein ACLKA7_005785 [Drosophila subpalustris]
MSDGDDNACDYDVDMEEFTFPDKQDQAADNCKSDADGDRNDDADADASDAHNLLKQFAELTFKMLDAENESVRSEITAYQHESQQLMEEKMSLLCSLNKPQVDASCSVMPLSTVKQIGKTQKEVLDKFRYLFDAENEYVRAYDQHCDEAIKAKMANAELDEYDEFTELPHDTLVEYIEEMKTRIESVKASCEKLRAERAMQQKANKDKYISIMKEVELFEKYNVEALETLEMKKFEFEQLPRVLHQQIQFD